MTSNEIQKGKKYWVRPSDEAAARPLLVWKISPSEPRHFHCIDANGEGCIVFADAFVRPVEPMPAVS